MHLIGVKGGEHVAEALEQERAGSRDHAAVIAKGKGADAMIRTFVRQTYRQILAAGQPQVVRPHDPDAVVDGLVGAGLVPIGHKSSS